MQHKYNLDVTFNLNSLTYKRYQEHDNKILYICKDSNHLPNILKQIPTLIQKRVLYLFSCETILMNQKKYTKNL